MSEYSHLGDFSHGLSINFDLDDFSVQNRPSVRTHSSLSAFLKCTPPERRFWKELQKMKMCVFEGLFEGASTGFELPLEPFKMCDQKDRRSHGLRPTMEHDVD